MWAKRECAKNEMENSFYYTYLYTITLLKERAL